MRLITFMFALLTAAPAAASSDLALLIEAAKTQCPLNHSPDGELVEALFSLEDRVGLASAARGRLAAAAWQEAAYSPDPGAGDGGASIGIVQFQGWARSGIRAIQNAAHWLGGRPVPPGDPRLDWEAAGLYWLTRVQRSYDEVRTYCRGRRGYRTRAFQLWASANLTAVRSPKYVDGRRVPRCARRGSRVSETKHIRRLRSWRSYVRNLEDNRDSTKATPMQMASQESSERGPSPEMARGR